MTLFSYAYVVEKQPIGRILFKQFCEETDPHELGICWRFLERVEEFEISGMRIRICVILHIQQP